MRQRIGAAILAGALLLCVPAGAGARAGTTPRATVDIGFSTTKPGSPAGFTYSASFRNPADPAGTPPALRRLILGAPRGSLVDTTVPARCTASDAELKQSGGSVCPGRSRIGTGTADVKPIVFPTVHYITTIYNADHQQVELLRADPPTPSVVVRGYFKGYSLDSPLPTCINGGYPPDDCPDDQASLLRNRLDIPPYTVGSGASRRTYFTTPPTCPPSHAWRSPVKLYYGDGVVENSTTTQPCHPAPTRLRVAPRRVRRLSRRRFRFRATVLVGGGWQPLDGAHIRVGRRILHTDGAGRARGRIRFKRSGRRRARLTKTGYGSSTTRVRVRPSR